MCTCVGSIPGKVSTWFSTCSGYHVTLKMKRAAVALASLGAETRRRRRSFHKRHGKSENHGVFVPVQTFTSLVYVHCQTSTKLYSCLESYRVWHNDVVGAM